MVGTSGRTESVNTKSSECVCFRTNGDFANVPTVSANYDYAYDARYSDERIYRASLKLYEYKYDCDNGRVSVGHRQEPPYRIAGSDVCGLSQARRKQSKTMHHGAGE